MIKRFDNFQLLKKLILENKYVPRNLYVHAEYGRIIYSLDGKLSGYDTICIYSISDGVCILDELIDILHYSLGESVEKQVEEILLRLYSSKTKINSFSDTIRNDIEYSLDILYNRFPEKALLIKLGEYNRLP